MRYVHYKYETSRQAKNNVLASWNEVRSFLHRQLSGMSTIPLAGLVNITNVITNGITNEGVFL